MLPRLPITVIASSSSFFIPIRYHFNLQERYPRSFAYFKPDSRSEAKSENRRDLLNAYDNTIRYTDYILHGIIERLQKWEGIRLRRMGYMVSLYSAMLYTSDHGEIVSMMSAASSFMLPKASDYELHVPFIIWTSEGFSKQYPDILKALEETI